MRDCVVFNGLDSLDIQEIRFNVIRIPEVIRRVHQAQEIWDLQEGAGFDFANFIASEDRIFLSNIKLKSLAAAVVQLGLYDRYTRFFKEPEFFIGSSTGDAPVMVAVGRMTFAEMVRESPALRLSRPTALVQLADQPQLAGMSLTQYAAFQRIEDKGLRAFHDIETDGCEIQTIVLRMLEELDVRRFVNVGPGNLLIHRDQPEFEMVDIQILESIELDPLLTWFWAGRSARQGVREATA